MITYKNTLSLIKLLFFLLFVTITSSCLNINEKKDYSYTKCNIEDIDLEHFDNICSDHEFEIGEAQFFKIEVQSEIDQDLIFWLFYLIDREIRVYFLQEGKIINSYNYGWLHKNFPKNREFGLPLKFKSYAGQTTQILLYIEDEGWTINNGFEILKENAFHQTIEKEKLIKIICRSLFLILLSIGFFCALQLKKKVFFIYLINSLLSIIYFESEYGFILNLIADEYLSITKYIYVSVSLAYHTTSITLYSLIIFPNKKKLQSIIDYVLAFGCSCALLVVIYMLFLSDGTSPSTQTNLLNFTLLHIFIIDNCIIIMIIMGLKKKVKLAYYSLIIFIVTNVIVIIFSVLPNANLMPKYTVNRYVFFLMASGDMIAYLLLLLFQTSKLIKEKNKLLFQYIHTQESIPTAYQKSSEKERKKITSKLNKDIINELIYIDKNIDKSNQEDIHDKLDSTIYKVRELSHDLVSSDLSNDYFDDSLDDLIFKQRYSKIDIFPEFSSTRSLTNTYLKVKTFRIIQALLDESMTYPASTQLYLTVIYNQKQNQINISYESNIFEKDRSFQKASNQTKLAQGSFDLTHDKNGTFIEIKLIGYKKTPH